MGAVDLGARLGERLAARGAPLPLPEARALIELCRFTLRWGLGHDEPDTATHRRVAERVAALGGWPVTAALAAVELATEPEHRSVTEGEELAAFAMRFGAAAARLLRETDAGERDLAQWAEEQGAARAVALLEVMVELSGERLGTEDRRRLQDAARELGVDELVLAGLLARRHPVDLAPVPLQDDRVRIGSGPECELFLPDPQVARVHCTLVRTTEGWRVADAGSGRPTLVGSRAVGSAPWSAQEELGVGPYRLRLVDEERAVAITAPGPRQVLSVRNLQRRIEDIVLLDDVSFTVASGEVIAIVGPSGCGKTTLLNAITGVAPPDSGQVRLDGRDFHAVLDQDRTRVGSVPQDDIVLPELTVQESLASSARLRLPAGSAPQAVEGAVDRVLAELDIGHIRRSRIGDALRRGISGGQRKRVNLGQELLTQGTSILFLDEPTSGLDPRAAQDIVRLVRQLADRGRIVFLVTHDLTPQVMAQVDHLMVLVPGGRLAWFGPPAEACAYFGVPTPDAIFHCLEQRSPPQWGAAWRTTAQHRKRVESREVYLAATPDEASLAAPRTRPPGPLSHLASLTRRYARVKSRDRTGLWVLGAQPPFLAVVMGIVFPQPTAEMLFMLTLSCLWFGMSAAVRELIADRAVWRRERRIGVGVLPYVGSKVAVLSVLAIAQCSLLATAVWGMFGLGAHGFPPVELAALASLVGLCGMALGLLVSAAFSSSEAAVGSLPLLLIPQISFSALLVDLRNMSPLSRALSWADPLRYAFEAMLKVGETISAPTRIVGKWEDQPYTGPLYDFGFKGTSVADTGLAASALVGALSGFTVAFLVAAVILVWRRRE